MEYKIKYKKSYSLFWKTKIVVGHNYEKEIDKMILYFSNGSQLILGNWSIYDMFLDVDWVLCINKKMEAESGQKIPLKVSVK